MDKTELTTASLNRTRRQVLGYAALIAAGWGLAPATWAAASAG